MRLRAVTSPPSKIYGADPYIKGQQLGQMIVGKYA